MFDDEIDDDYQNKKEKRKREWNLVEKDCDSINSCIDGCRKCSELKKMETLLVDLMWTENSKNRWRNIY